MTSQPHDRPEVVHLLANTRAGGGDAARTADQLAERFVDADVEVVELDAASPAEAQALAATAVARGADRLVVVGGDGLVHLAVQSLAGQATALCVVPAGTGNDFAGALGITADLDRAVTHALGPVRTVDLLRAGERWVASIATLGFSAAVNARANRLRWPRGSLRYSAATVLELPRLASRRVRLDVDGRSEDLDVALVTIANTSDFGGGMRISPEARPDDGVADLTIVGDARRFELLWFFRKVFDGSHLDHPKVSTRSGRRIHLDATDTELWADGEPLGLLPQTIEVVPGALRLAHPAPTTT